MFYSVLPIIVNEFNIDIKQEGQNKNFDVEILKRMLLNWRFHAFCSLNIALVFYYDIIGPRITAQRAFCLFCRKIKQWLVCLEQRLSGIWPIIPTTSCRVIYKNQLRAILSNAIRIHCLYYSMIRIVQLSHNLYVAKLSKLSRSHDALVGSNKLLFSFMCIHDVNLNHERKPLQS